MRIGLHLPLEQRPRATCAVCLVQQGSAYWAHVGDSRIYLLRHGAVAARTRDHSHVELLLREGLITPDQAHNHPMRNYVECCLGGDPVLPDMTMGSAGCCSATMCCSSAPTGCGAACATPKSPPP